MDQDELIQHSREGDANSFNKLVESYQQQVYNLCLRMLGNVPDAEDATQDAFISAWKAIKGFRRGNFRAWLSRIAANACRDQLRRQKRHAEVSLETSVSELRNDTGGQLENQVLSHELAQEIQRGLTTLPYQQRLAVVLRDIEGFSYEEISQTMHCSLGTVRSRLSRGRAQLRDFLLSRELLTPK
jgi:RNA polymerase sigma-70 factor (ECF subfamily)